MASKAFIDDGKSIAIHGPIDGSFDLCQILRTPYSLINFEHVVSINSLGGKGFLNFVDQWNGRRFSYLACPVVMMDAFVFLPKLLGPVENTVSILSFAAPYECRVCDTEIPIMLTPDDLALAAGKFLFPDDIRCPTCKRHANLQDSSENYRCIVAAGALQVAKAA